MKKIFLIATLAFCTLGFGEKLSKEQSDFFQTNYISPAFKDSEIIGMTVISADKHSRLLEYKVKPKDIILKINNVEIKTLDDLKKQINLLADRKSVITVSRNNKPTVLKHQLK